MVSLDEILKQGYVDVKVSVAGLRQAHRLEVSKEPSNIGTIVLLVSKHYIPSNELVRLADILQLPIRHKTTIVFPRGKMAGHFIEPGTEKKSNIIVDSQTIEAEVED